MEQRLLKEIEEQLIEGEEVLIEGHIIFQIPKTV